MGFAEWRYHRWVRRRCPHPEHRVVCLHAKDAPLGWSWLLMGVKSDCLECGARLKFRYPICYWTGTPHVDSK